MAAEVRETENKYEFKQGAALPCLGDLPGVSQESDLAEQKLEADYYDTSDLCLVRAGVTLRRRHGGGDAGWHLKLPLEAGSRREIRLPLGRAGRRVPAELATLVRAYARGQALAPVALITTVRRPRALLDASGAVLAEVATDDVSARTMGESTTLTHWREVEVELAGGGPRLLRAADKRLRRSGLRPAGYAAKLERALADQLPAPEGGSKLTLHSAAGDVVLAYARSQVAVLQALDPMIRRDEPDSVHDMRVATRRLRSALKSFTQILDLPDAGRLRAELKWLGGVLGEARDNEVLAPYLHARLAEVPVDLLMGPVQARVGAHFAPRAASARVSLLAALDSSRFIALLNDLDQAFGGPLPAAKAHRPAAEVLPAAVRRARRRVRRRARRAAQTAAGPARELAMHETRKAAKDARYAAEAAALADRKKYRRSVRRMKKLQGTLGDQHDAVVARDTAREIGVRAHLAGENAFSFGLLYEGCQRDALMLEKQAMKQWAQAFGPQ